ncbi:MAG: tetratricopeptide repeat protein [Candidatus Micrarchaeia archaeon]
MTGKKTESREKIKTVSQMLQECDSLLRRGRIKEAAEGYEKLRISAPEMGITWYMKGKALYMLGRLDEAIKCCDESAKRSPDQWLPYALKAKCLFDLGKLEDAMIEYGKALKLNPKVAEVLISLAFCHMLRNDTKKAREYGKAAMQANPDKTKELISDMNAIIAGSLFLESEKTFVRMGKEFKNLFADFCRFMEDTAKALGERRPDADEYV